MNMRWFWVLGLLFGLAACGSDDDTTVTEAPPIEVEPEPVLSISGTITPVAGFTYDSDLNDKLSISTSRFTGNDTINTAQRIDNLGVVHGFASYRSTGFTADRFGREYDEFDTYRVELEAGQRIQLQVVDHERVYQDDTGPTRCDLDLLLLQPNGQVVTYSNGTGEFEQIVVPEAGIYYVKVEAYQGISKYVMYLMAPEQSQPAQVSPFVSGDVIVKFKPNTGLSAQQVRAEYAASLSHPGTSRPALMKLAAPMLSTASVNSAEAAEQVALTQARTLRAIKDLRQRSDVEYAEPNFLYRSTAVPDDDDFVKQWHYRQIKLPEAWNITTGQASPSVIVAVIDSGVYLEHPDLVDNLIDGYDFISEVSNAADGDGLDANPDDPGDSAEPGESSYHGTHVAGTIAATSNNAQGVAGVSWHARIMPLRALGRWGGSTWDIMQAISYAAGLENDSDTLPDRRADIINMSLGGPAYSTAMQRTIADARDTGVIIVAAAGNEGTAAPQYPASYDGVISVSATNARPQITSYSSFGDMVDVAAPGGEMSEDLNRDNFSDGIYSTWVSETGGVRSASYGFMQGTSMAAPHVAGVLALMKARYPALTPDNVDAALAQGLLTTDIDATGWDERTGFGLVDAFKAVTAAGVMATNVANDLPPVAPLPARVLAQPNWLSAVHVGAQTTPGRFLLRNVGDSASATVTSVASDQPWVTVSPDDISERGFGSYLVTVNSEGLSEASHVAQITVILDISGNAETLIVPVFLRVEAGGTASSKMAPQYVVLYDARTGAAVTEYQTELDSEADTFNFYDLEPGFYFIMAGSDVDQDNLICQQGETCGAWPDIFQVNAFEYTGLPLADLDISVNVQSKFSYLSDEIQVSNGLKVKLSALSKVPVAPQQDKVAVNRRAP